MKTNSNIKALVASALTLVASFLSSSTARAAVSIDTGVVEGPATIGEFVPTLTNTLLYAAGIIAVIMIIVGGIMYSLSAGDSKKAGTAKDTILYAVIGLVITLLAGAIVNFVLGRF